jgi:uncharacterized protein
MKILEMTQPSSEPKPAESGASCCLPGSASSSEGVAAKSCGCSSAAKVEPVPSAGATVCCVPTPSPLSTLPDVLAMTALHRVLEPVKRAFQTATPPVVAVAAILAALAVAMPAQAVESIRFSLSAFWSILPFFAVSVALAAGAKATGADALVGRAFSGREGRAVFIAALAGALSPFCSCGVIPVITAFLMAGVPLAPVMAFWISSPLMDPNMFVLTAGGLGIEFALAKTAAAIGMGLFSGYVTMALSRTVGFTNVLKIETSASGCGCKSTKPDLGAIRWRFWEEPARAQTFLTNSGKNAWFLGRWLLLAFVLESLMVAFIPGDFVAKWLGSEGSFAIPLAVGMGIPAYLNGYAAIPLVGGLIKLGMSPAVGLGFMLGGGVTSIPAALAVWAVAKPRLFGLYLALAILGSLGSAYAYAFFLMLRG